MDAHLAPKIKNSKDSEILEDLLPKVKLNYTDNILDNIKYDSTTSCYETDDKLSKKFYYEYRSWYVILLTINAATGNFFIGWNIGVFDPIQKHLSQMFNWTNDEEKLYLSLISSSLQFGAMFGALFSGYISRKLGRRKTYLYLDLISWVGISLTLIVNEYTMILGRLISGICVGVYSPLVCVYVNETAPYKISGICGAIYETCFCMGIFLSYIAGLNLPEENQPMNNWWRVMVSIPGILNAINMVNLLMFFKNEPPKFLYINKKETEKCANSLRCIYKSEDDVKQMLKDFKNFSEVQSSENGLSMMFKKKYRPRLFIACVLMIGQLVSGTDVIFMYSDHIYYELLGDKHEATIYTIYTGLAMVAAGISSILIIEPIGRRKLLMIGQSLLVLDLLVISLMYYFNCVYSVVIYFFIFSIFLNGISISPISYIYSSDILPENGVSLAVVSNYLTDFILCTSFLFMEKSFLKMHGTIGVYCIFSTIVLILSFSYVKETRNMSSKQIDDLFKK